MITHYDLFAGIGGFSLALEEVFNDQQIKHIFCEWERFPTAVLKKHWPGGEYWGNITDLVAHTAGEGLQGVLHRPREVVSGIEETPHARRSDERNASFTILTGGFPCQPFSHAGKRRGTDDHRYQWPNMFAVIQNVKPEWVIAENVRGLVTWNEGMVLEQVCSDLESEGYEVQPFIIPAIAVNAPHRRDRVWIIAHASHKRSVSEVGLERKQDEKAAKPSSESYTDWSQDWREIALATCHAGLDDGLPRWVDDAPLSGARTRVEEIKAYGNSIVPQVAMEIFRSIRIAEESHGSR